MRTVITFLCAVSLAAFSAHAQLNWQFDNGPYFARIHDFAVGVKDGITILYAADSSEHSLLKSTNRGESWIHVLGGAGVHTYVRCVATVKNNPDIVYAGVLFASGGLQPGVYKSINGGTTWTYLQNQPANPFISRVAIHPTDNDRIWVGCFVYAPPPLFEPYPVLYKSTDGGPLGQISRLGSV